MKRVSQHKFVTGMIEVKSGKKTEQEFLAETGYKNMESAKRRGRKIREQFCSNVGTTKRVNVHQVLNLKDAGIL